MEMKVKNRGWVKNVAIIFLAVLLVLTFFSNTIMNRSLPEVATAYVQSESINSKVRGTGKVVANGSYEVKAEQSRKIAAVLVRAGQEVSAGDILFVLGEGESEELAAATEELRQLQLSYSREALSIPSFDNTILRRARENAQAAYLAAERARNLALLELKALVPEEELEKLEAFEEAMDQKGDEYESIVAAKDEEREALRLTADNLYLFYLEKQAILTALESDPDATEEEKAAARSEMEAAEAAYNAAYIAYQNSLAETPVEAAARLAFEAARAAYEEQLEKVNKDGLFDNYLAAKRAAEEAKLEFEDRDRDLEAKIREDEKQLALAYLTLSDISYKIQRIQDKIKQLSGDGDNNILAPAAGIVESVSVTAGNTPVKGDLLCTLEVPDLGYSLSFSVTNEQARRVRVGESATITNYYWGHEIIATLRSIERDPKNPQNAKLLTFDLEGDISVGSELTVSIGSRSSTYDIVVPNNSIRSDSNGSFVLLIEAKNNALGNRYFARRVSVEVIASDDVNSAVVGDLSYWDFVITTSNSPVSAGDQVRLAENS